MVCVTPPLMTKSIPKSMIQQFSEFCSYINWNNYIHILVNVGLFLCRDIFPQQISFLVFIRHTVYNIYSIKSSRRK